MNPIRISAALSLLAPIALAVSCNRPVGSNYTPDEQHELLSSIAADKIVVEPFTQPASFDEDAIPDGIQAFITALDKQGEPTKITGRIVFELYNYRAPAPDPKGAQIQTWRLDLADDKDQQTDWNHTTLMYEFPLETTLSAIPPSRKFVLLARYTNPWDEHLEHEAVIDLSGLISELKEQLRSASND